MKTNTRSSSAYSTNQRTEPRLSSYCLKQTNCSSGTPIGLSKRDACRCRTQFQLRWFAHKPTSPRKERKNKAKPPGPGTLELRSCTRQEASHSDRRISTNRRALPEFHFTI